MLVLGIDGGGTSTEVWVASPDGRIRAEVVAAGSNVRTLGASDAINILDEAIDRALQQAGANDSDVAAVVAGLAGIGHAAERKPIDLWLKARFGQRPRSLVTDIELVLAAGTPNRVGIAVVSGTGSIALGRSPAGEMVRAGGWGATVGDRGSGDAIGRAALEALALAHDGIGQATTLIGTIARRHGGRSLDQLTGSLRQPADVAALAPIVAEVAATGDAVAAGILEDAGADLAVLASALLTRLGWPNAPVPVGIGGGVLIHIERVRDSFLRNLEQLGCTPSPIGLVERPVRGAISLAAGLLPTDKAASR